MFPSLRRSHVNCVEPHSDALASLETTSAGTRASNPSLRQCLLARTVHPLVAAGWSRTDYSSTSI
jgi:hypothetical protein